MTLDDLELSTRARTVLTRIGVETVGDLVALPDAKLRATPGVGPRLAREIEDMQQVVRAELGAAPYPDAPPRVAAALAAAGIETVEQLVADSKLAGIPNPALRREAVDYRRQVLTQLIGRDPIGLAEMRLRQAWSLIRRTDPGGTRYQIMLDRTGAPVIMVRWTEQGIGKDGE